jgi:hypothetical protein
MNSNNYTFGSQNKTGPTLSQPSAQHMMNPSSY